MKSLGSARALGVRCPRVVVFLLGIVCAGAPAVHAQELSEDEIVTLGLMGEEMLSRGTLDGGDDDMVEILDLSWAYGLPDLEATPDDARELLRFSREERERRSRYEGVVFRFGTAGPRLLRAGQKLTCDQMREKAQQARRVASTLRKVTAMYGVGLAALQAGGTVVGAVAARFTWPLNFAIGVVGISSIYADQLATAYENAPCGALGVEKWKLESIRAGGDPSSAINHGRSRFSSRRRSGSSPVG